MDVLAPYAVETDQIAGLRSTYAVADRAGAVQKDPQSMELDVTGRELILQQ